MSSVSRAFNSSLTTSSLMIYTCITCIYTMKVQAPCCPPRAPVGMKTGVELNTALGKGVIAFVMSVLTNFFVNWWSYSREGVETMHNSKKSFTHNTYSPATTRVTAPPAGSYNGQPLL